MLALLLFLSMVTSDWQVYRDPSSGYTVEYPADWSVDYGDSETQFTSPSGRVGITIAVGDAYDNAGFACSAVEIGGLPAERCEDILTFSVWTTVLAGDRAFTIASSEKNFDGAAYEHVLETFSL